MLSHTLKDKLRELKLSGIAETMQAREELAREQQLSPTEFLALLLDDEIERRNQSRLLRQEKEAGFESPKRLSQFDFSAAPVIPRSLVMEMASCQFITRKENWIISGPTGVGKSHLSTWWNASAEPSPRRMGVGGKPDRIRLWTQVVYPD